MRKVIHDPTLGTRIGEEKRGRRLKSRNRIVTELSSEVREKVDAMLSEGKTYAEVRKYLNSNGYNLSKASVERYGKRFVELLERSKIVKEQARMVIAEGGDGLAIGEALLSMSLRQKYEDLRDGKIDRADMPRFDTDVSKLVTAYVQLARFKADLEKTADMVAETARNEGVSSETIEKIRREVLMMTVN